MQVNFNMNPAGRSALHTNNIHKGLQRQQAVHQAGSAQRQDRTNISPQGKIMNRIENLTKQKENVILQKSNLVTQTLEKGKRMKTIAVQLELYEEKLSSLDEQISQATATLAEGMLEQAKEQAPKKKDEDETQEQADTKRLSKIAYATDGTKQAQIISRTKSKVQGEIKIKESENKLVELDIERLQSKAMGTNIKVDDMVRSARQKIKTQKTNVAELNEKLGDLGEMQSKAVSKDRDALEELHEDEKSRSEQKAAEQPTRESAEGSQP